ncbi:hypothetical protein D3C71_351530 [compost metagenome]
MVAAAVGVGSAVAGVAGSAMSSSAAGKAANAQKAAADEANAITREQYEQNSKNLQPYMDAGLGGLNALQFYMGLGTGTGGRALTEQEIRNELMGQYTTGGQAGSPPSITSLLASNPGYRGASNAEWGFDPSANRWGYKLDYIQGGDAGGTSSKWLYADPSGATSDSIDEAGLNAAVQARLAQQTAAQNDPRYGSLLQAYKEYKPFSEADFKVDPGYQFRLDQGNKALQNMAAATGNLNSGRALKDAIAYNSGQGAQEYASAYGRYNNDYLTGFNTHTTNQNNIYNKLMGLTGIGQSSASALANVGQNYSGQVSNNLAQGANAQAAGIVGQSNAVNQGLGTAANALGNYFTNRGSGYSGQFQATPGVPSMQSGQGLNGWW